MTSETPMNQHNFAALQASIFDLPTYEILRTSTPPALDGWLDSSCWHGARWIDRFICVETAVDSGKPTATALLWDDQYLYVGIKCSEPRLGDLHAAAAEPQDAWNDDVVEVYLNPDIVGIESVDTVVNAAGVACPALRVISDPGWGSYQYQQPGGVRAVVRFTGKGWQGEIAFPFGEHQLPFPRAGQRWRGNICRHDRMGFTWSYWALGQSPGYTYSDDKLFPYLRFSEQASMAPPPHPSRVAWRRQPRFALRGMMYDTSRGSQVYRHEYWMDKLPLLADLGYNTLMMYFENHLRYPSHPEFAPNGAWTLPDLVTLQEAGAQQGIDIIPAQTSLGHCPGILEHPAYRHLAEEGSDGYQFCIAHPETQTVLSDIFNELCAASSSPYININADESAYLGLCPRCRKEFAGWSQGRILRHHLLKLYEVIHAYGKRMMMWDDMLWLYPDAVDGLPRDIVLLDWHYNLHRRYPSVDAWRAAGFEVVVCPGMYAVENAFWLADYGAARGAMGLINTLWEDHSLPLGSRWQHLLATAWAACAPAPRDVDAWFAAAGARFFGPAGTRLGHSLAAQDNVKRNGYFAGGSTISPPELFAARQVRDEAECLLATANLEGEPRTLLEEFLYAQRLLVLQAEAEMWKATGARSGLERERILAQAAALRSEGLARWEKLCVVPSQQPAFLERFTAIERALE